MNVMSIYKLEFTVQCFLQHCPVKQSTKQSSALKHSNRAVKYALPGTALMSGLLHITD